MKNKRGIKFRIFCTITVIAMIALGCGLYFRSNIIPLVTQKAYYTVKGETVKALNTAYEATVNEMHANSYEDFVDVTYDDKGDVSFISVNMTYVNSVMSYISTVILEEMQKLLFTGVDVPIGAFSGIVLLGDSGGNVNIEIEVVGIAECNFRTEFESVGINQVKHSLYIDLVASADLVLPLYAKDVECTSSLLMCENIIVGDVPEFYLSNPGVFDISAIK